MQSNKASKAEKMFKGPDYYFINISVEIWYHIFENPIIHTLLNQLPIL